MCLKPVTFTKKACDRWYKQFTVPCGKCAECVKDMQNEYVIRTVEEQKKRGTVLFITLTYNEGSVPKFTEDMDIDEETGEIYSDAYEYRSLCRKDLVEWKKRVCQRYYRDYGVRLNFGYLLCGEYGPKTHRPHYHGLLLGLTKEQCQMFIDDWTTRYGFVCAKYVPTIKNDVVKVARYCSKYICKIKEWDLMPSPHAERPRKLTSVGYGCPDERRFKTMKDYYLAKNFIDYDENNISFKCSDVDRLVDEIIKRRKYKLDGREYKLPAYYRKRFFYHKGCDGKVRATQIQHLISFTVQRRAAQDFEERVQELKALYNLRDYAEAVDKYNELHEADIQAREKAIIESCNRYYTRSKI